MLQKGYSGFKRFNEVMETQVEIQDAPDSHDLVNVQGVIDYKDVSFGYDDEKVLDHLNIHIDSGKSIALVGPSGGGKTTICSLLLRFYDVTGGSIEIDGQDIRKLTLKSLRQSIGIVQQDVYLFTGLLKKIFLMENQVPVMKKLLKQLKKRIFMILL